METDEKLRRRQKTPAESNAEYWKSLERWMNTVRSMTVSCNMIAPGLPFPFTMGMPGVPLMNMGGPIPPAHPLAHRPPNTFYNFNNPDPTVTIRLPGPYVEHVIPPLWKRFVAELIDFFILFFMKLAVTFVAVDLFEIVDFDKYDLSKLTDENIDYEMALEMTQELIVLEFIHRIVVCIYEGIFLTRFGNMQWGATPGKCLMGLRVVLCEQLLPGPTPNIGLISPATPIPFRLSLLRAVLKNMILAFIFPICFPLFFNKFNRAGYDLMSRTIVVEEPRHIRVL